MLTLASFSDQLAAAVARASQSVVAVHARPKTPSSGVVWRPGVIVTASHTVRQDDDITIELPSGDRVPATLAGRDAGTDLAVLRAEIENPPSTFGDSATLKTGNLVLAVGRHQTASFGTVSKSGPPWRTWRGGEVDQSILLDLSILIGFSGGALVDPNGSVLGINSSGLSRHSAMSIPVTTVNRITDSILERGNRKRGYLGIGMQPIRLPDSLKVKTNPPAEGGLILLSVEPGSPAATAGLLPSDILVAIAGHPLTDLDHLQPMLDPENVGKALSATILRGGEPVEIAVTIGER